jgi:hypothetical protein
MNLHAASDVDEQRITVCSFPFCVYFSLNLTELFPTMHIHTYLLAHSLEYLFELLLHQSKYKCVFT